MLLTEQTIRRALAIYPIAALALTFGFPGTTQAQATAAVSPLQAAHPGWVQVPGMLIRPDCVHKVPNGARIETNGDKITGDVTMGGRVIAHYEACSETPIKTRPLGGVSPKSGTTPGTGNGWVEAIQEDVSLTGSDDIDWLSGTWTVPSNPSSNGGLIYLFNGLEPATQNWILQPVLQYGNNGYFGGNYWVIASWMVSSGGYVFYSPMEKVSPGDTIYGATYITGEASGKLNWEVWAQDTTHGQYSWITAYTTGLHWTWAYAGVLESYYISSCAEFPASDYTVFKNTAVYHGFPNYTAVPARWSGWVSGSWTGPSCGFDPYPDGTLDYLFW